MFINLISPFSETLHSKCYEIKECYCHLEEVNVKYYYLLQFIVNTVKRFLNVFLNTLFNQRIFIFLKQRCTDSQSLFGHTRIFISSQTKKINWEFLKLHFCCSQHLKKVKLYYSSFKKYIQFDEKETKACIRGGTQYHKTFNVGNPWGHDIHLARNQSFARVCW